MFDIGMGEFVVIGVVALIVIGPEDLPEMFRQLGRITGKLRQMGREFQRAMDQAAKETGVKDVAKDLGSLTSPKSMGLDAVKAAADKFEKWDPVKAAAARAVPKAATAGEAAADAAEAEMEARTIAATSGMTPATMTLATPAPAAPFVPTPVPTAPPAAAEVVAPAGAGPETRALYEKQAAKKKVIDDSVARLKAIEAGEAPAAVPKTRKPRAAKPAAETPVEKATKSASRRKAADSAAPDPAPAAAPARKSRKKDAEA